MHFIEPQKADLAIYSCFVCVKATSITVISINKIDFANKDDFLGAITYTINIKHLTPNHALNSIRICITIATLVLIRLQKAANLLETKVNSSKDRMVLVGKYKL